MSTAPLMIDLQSNLPALDKILADITHIHASCIEYDHTEATFIPPLSYSKMLQYWQDRFAEVHNKSRRIWVELHPVSSRKAQLASPLAESEPSPIQLTERPGELFEVGGVVALYMPTSETGPFRAEVHKLLVSPNHRQKGIAKRLMRELETFALKEGRWNLMLDTEVGSAAESVYPRLGYTRVGVVPDYGYSPISGKMCDEVWFYKDLQKSAP